MAENQLSQNIIIIEHSVVTFTMYINKYQPLESMLYRRNNMYVLQV